MIRFSLRPRGKEARRMPVPVDPADRPQKPLGKASSPVRGPPASFLVNYDALPTRRPDGTALDYNVYQPSKYFQSTRASRTRRRARAATEQKPPGFERPTSTAAELGLDFDSLQRNKQAPAVADILQFVPVEKRIRAKIADLRALLREAEHMGDIEVLKDLVGIHRANLANHQHAAQNVRAQIKEAKIIAGMTEKPVVMELEQKNTLIRKVSGKPVRHITGRNASALKSRTASMRSATRGNQRIVPEHRNDNNRPPGRENHPPGPTKGKIELSRLTRKSSSRLKRLGSAGSVLIRRLSKVSVAEDASSGSSTAETPISSTFDQGTMKRLKVSPVDVIAEYDAELKRVLLVENAENEKLRAAKERLEKRRSIHDKAMAILDQFYGSLPGWEDDPVAVRMLPDTAEMTEAGIEAERDLAEMRLTRERVFAAHEDHCRALTALGSISANMSLFVERLEALVSSLDDYDENSRLRGGRVNIDRGVVSDILKDLGKLMRRCVQNATVARECCTEAPRLGQIERDLGKLEEGFTRESEAVMKQGTVYRNDFGPTLQVAKSTLCDCKLAETFVAERRNMISEDLETFDSKVERYEEYVMMERIGILDTYHPPHEDR